ncbi:MAG: dicarboxylate/amino acid:cation symporter [Phaeodactylibacter sp.]|nr:dicarboxylate/amino acid:cation symporter [Phaeodactylibacter sp.]MCB9302993.1 dicarboxylate/amino acid:cation symporter [Lewinellaceae bacterium]
MKKLALHWQILIGMAAGVLFGLLAAHFQWKSFVVDWIKPFGAIFINLLKVIAIPLIIASLIKGVSDLKDISKLSTIGFRTLAMFIGTTMFSISVGLVVVNLIQPGKLIDAEVRNELLENYAGDASKRIQAAAEQQAKGPLQPLIDLVPDNIVGAAGSNGNMLQVIIFVTLFGIALVMVPEERARPVKAFFDSTNDVILKLIDLIMLSAPYGVFALLAALIVESPSISLFIALIGYSACVLIGLAIMILFFYPTLVRLFTGKRMPFFLKGIAPAQLVAFSTSSSAATLPVTMECVQENLGVEEEVAGFVLPVGATVNMDGTSLYQAVAAVFIAQSMGLELSISAQLGIIVTATLASIGAAAVPGAGMITLVIVLAQAGIPEAGLALIFAVDRPLDMCRTIANVTGDATVSMVVANSVGKLGEPKIGAGHG